MAYIQERQDDYYNRPNTRAMNASKQTLNSTVENLRLLTENCSSLEGFLITNSFGGGTGSGLTTRLMEIIAAEYGNGKSKSRIWNSKSSLTRLYKKFRFFESLCLLQYCYQWILFKFQFAIAPSQNIANSVVEPYNSMLHIHKTMEFTDCCFMFDNEALYDICTRSLSVETPTYESINRLIAQVKTLP